MPLKTEVMGQQFTIEPTQDLQIEHHHGHDEADGEPLFTLEDVMGACNPDRQLIRVEVKDIGPDRLREVYLHEHLHAMLALGGFRDLFEGDDEERFVKRFAPILLMFLRVNPGVYTYLASYS